MKITEIEVEKLIPYANNPRNNDEAVDKVAASIHEFGFKVPVVVDSENVIVCGHTRVKAAKKLGLATVPCVVADDLTDAQIKAFRLADNRVSEYATWNFEKLEIELEGLHDFNFDFGFDFDFSVEKVTEPEPQEDETEEEELDIERLEKYYGVPYQGNKSRIADIIINLLPSGRRLVDLFGGGGAITHCAMLSGKWEYFLYNDINPLITELFMNAIDGKYKDERRVITREQFFELVNVDPVVKYMWSFGNDGKSYLWGKDDEETKLQACRIVLAETPNERRLEYVRFIKMLPSWSGGTLARLQAIEHLQALTQLEALKRLEALNIDYRDYKYEQGDIVYCDIPYEKLGENMSGYGVDFDNLEFYEWAKSADFPVFFSSYEISDKSFYKKKVKSIMQLKGATTNGRKVNEYLYSNRPFDK